ncbi:RagB/SusD family nutrient uptake outer membrane protein [Pedobacter sp. MC2016-14]|uniref:RagB/SusD family nutrient uptake outer membrane protein n=1 Tax=Pedobacter sp. MC2016-14 TaxID=2897327 RepID=UPI001E5D5D8C|nr:RagB/SusD family nutrient uptake outer membrane protein [Pedobacter sp. MC2016-14]MCD0490666.1 RagB/SusD family nutrient uptake outer membrane protein [Pedobacter sp. MC2016-14]
MKTFYNIVLILTLAGLTSCKKWLDVKPKTEIESTSNFSNEQGFKDALTGVYVNMTSPGSYGKELSFGFIEVLGKNYTQFTNAHGYFEDSKYNYLFSTTKSRIDGLWSTGYSTIANINNLIENIDKADRSLFTETNYNVIRGEAYGLRAFNHFDLLRLFAPAPSASPAATTLAIPYRTRLSGEVVAQPTVAEFINKILADLQIAADALKPADPIVKGSTIVVPASGYLRDRPFKFNYYAVKALMARVYLYNGDKINALACAKEVFESGKFRAPYSYEITQTTQSDKIMSSEIIFNLNMNNLADLNTQNFPSTTGALSTGMSLSTGEWATVYETGSGGATDYRYVYQTAVSPSGIRTTIKFRPAENTSTLAANRLPLMRFTEMYYIAAECLKTTEPLTAIAYLNTVRRSMAINNDLATTLTESQIQDEIFKEYRKDFMAEGQLFFYYKRLNLSRIEFTQVPGSETVYVLPKPDNEIIYGSIN